MSNRSDRLRRVVRLREVEHRIAKAWVASAEAEMASLVHIDERLAKLRAAIETPLGSTTGMALHAATDMANRLDAARGAMAVPIAEADLVRQHKVELRSKAHRREEGASKLHDRAENLDATLHERRADANRIFRRPSPSVEDV